MQASDNVNLTSIYFLMWLLLGQQRAGGALQTVRISRMIVNHTHFDVSVLPVSRFNCDDSCHTHLIETIRFRDEDESLCVVGTGTSDSR